MYFNTTNGEKQKTPPSLEQLLSSTSIAQLQGADDEEKLPSLENMSQHTQPANADKSNKDKIPSSEQPIHADQSNGEKSPSLENVQRFNPFDSDDDSDEDDDAARAQRALIFERRKAAREAENNTKAAQPQGLKIGGGRSLTRSLREAVLWEALTIPWLWVLFLRT